MTRYVGVDLHRRRSVIVVLDSDGTELWTRRIEDDPLTLGLEIEEAGPAPEVVLEATWGWYWAADVIAEADGSVHLAHPLGIAGFENRRVKNDRIDARLLGDLLRMGRLPESWIAPEGSVIRGSWSATGGNCRSCGPVEGSGACRIGQGGSGSSHQPSVGSWRQRLVGRD
jgi:hypothetical protein